MFQTKEATIIMHYKSLTKPPLGLHIIRICCVYLFHKSFQASNYSKYILCCTGELVLYRNSTLYVRLNVTSHYFPIFPRKLEKLLKLKIKSFQEPFQDHGKL